VGVLDVLLYSSHQVGKYWDLRNIIIGNQAVLIGSTTLFVGKIEKEIFGHISDF